MVRSRKISAFSQIPNPEVGYENFLHEAQYHPGDANIFGDGRKIYWLNMDVAQAGQEFVRRNIVAVGAAHMIYLCLGLSVKTLASVLLKTGRFTGMENAMVRFLETIWHILRWYEEDIIGVYASGFKDVCSVRTTHALIRRKCNERKEDLVFDEGEKDSADRLAFQAAMSTDLKFLDCTVYESLNLSYNPPVFMSQFDMVLTLMGFFIPIYIQPEAFGIYDPEGLDSFEHLWALIGRLCGIHDRFNIPIQKPGREFYIKLWRETILPPLMDGDNKIYSLQTTFISASRKVVPMPSLKSCLYYVLTYSPLENYDGKELYSTMTYGERWSVSLMKFTFWLIGSSRIAKWLINRISWFYLKLRTRKMKRSHGENEEHLSKLTGDVKWSDKYRERDESVFHKWKKTEAMVSLMLSKKKKKK